MFVIIKGVIFVLYYKLGKWSERWGTRESWECCGSCGLVGKEGGNSGSRRYGVFCVYGVFRVEETEGFGGLFFRL